MTPMSESLANVEVSPVDAARWGDVERLFGPRGAYGGCWCMWWRLRRADFERQTPEQRKHGLKALLDAGPAPGLLAYVGGEPVGWCSMGPRETYPPLERSRTLKRIDDESVWSVVCFFVARPYRRRCLQAALLRAAVGYATAQGAKVVEGYPNGGFMGTERAFHAVGFEEVIRRSPTRPIMRYRVDGRNGSAGDTL